VLGSLGGWAHAGVRFWSEDEALLGFSMPFLKRFFPFGGADEGDMMGSKWQGSSR
jgi:hypothetical protein